MAYFAVVTRTGKELQAKEMIEHLLKHSAHEESRLVKAIYTLQTCTTYVQENVNNPPVEEDDTYNQLVSESIVSLLGNLRKQYDAIKDKTDEKSMNDKASIKEEISKLNAELKELRNESRKLKALLPGYIIIELHTECEYIPNNLWNLIMECPLVQAIPSRFSIPEEEMTAMFDSAVTESNIEIKFQSIMDDKEIMKSQTDLLHKANSTKDRTKEKKYLEQMDRLEENLVAKVNKLKKSSSATIDRIKAFIRNKKETVTMPVFLYLNLYHEYRQKSVLLTITPEDFLNRLLRLLSSHKVKLE